MAFSLKINQLVVRFVCMLGFIAGLISFHKNPLLPREKKHCIINTFL